MSQDQKNFVFPGDVIVTGHYRPEQNVILEDGKLIATAIGFSEMNDDKVKVIPLTGLYIPQIDDLVIGTIVSHNALSWEVNINSFYPGILLATDVFGRDYSPSKDDLSAKLNVGDIVAARVANTGSRDPLITINGQNLGKIDSGELVRISPAKVPRLIGKQGSIIQTIEAATNTSITIGQNGLIVFACDNSTSLKKSIACIKMVDLLLDDSNLEKKIQNMLDENN
jgi:exosome complex component RRP4